MHAYKDLPNVKLGGRGEGKKYQEVTLFITKAAALFLSSILQCHTSFQWFGLTNTMVSILVLM